MMTLQSKPRARPVPVDDTQNLWDAQVRELTLKGMGRKCISRITGLSLCQISYRRKELEVNTRDYALGKGTVAQQAINEVNRSLARAKWLNTSLRQILRRTPKDYTLNPKE